MKAQAGRERGLALDFGAAVLTSPAPAALKVGVAATGVTIVGPLAEQAASTSTAAEPAIAQHALTVYRMRINLVHLPAITAE